MAAALIAGGDAGDFKRYDVGVEQGDYPADGADETLGLAGAPVHILGPVNGEDFFGEFGGEDFGGGAAGALHRCADIIAFRVGDFLERGDVDASLFCECFGGLGGRAVFEGDGPRGAGELLFAVGLLGEDAVARDGEAARRGIGCNLRAGLEQTLAGEQVIQAAAEFGFRGGDHAGGNFFEAEFEKKRCHGQFFLRALPSALSRQLHLHQSSELRQVISRSDLHVSPALRRRAEG